MSGLARPADLSEPAEAVDAARLRSEKDPGAYRAALAAFAASTGSPVRVPTPSGGGEWLMPTRDRR